MADVKMILGDCMEFMANCKDKEFELAIVKILNIYDIAIDIPKYVGYIIITKNKEM